MKKLRWIVLILLVAFVNVNVTAQEVTYAPYEKFDLQSGDFSIIGKVGDRIYTYRGERDGCYMDAYNDSMEKIATVLLDFFPTKIYQTRFINYKDKIVVLYQAAESGKVVQYAALLDQTGRLLKGPIQLTSVKTRVFGGNRNYFSSAVSDDKKQILVYEVNERGEELRFSGIWLDDDLSIVEKGSAYYKADNDIEHSDGIIDNQGNFYLPTYTPVGGRNYADGFWLLSISKGGKSFAVKELPLNNLYATSVYLKLDFANSHIYTAGFYSSKKNGNYEGIIYAYYDLADSSWHQQKQLAFDQQLQNATGERNRRAAFNNYKVKDMIIKKDGGFVLIAEDFFVTTRVNNAGFGSYYYSYYYSPFMEQSIREYNYNDIFAISYDGDGKQDWHSFIRKNQYSQEDGGIFSSYALINTGGSLGFLFNDFNTRLSRIQLATIDANGKVDMRSLAAGSKTDPDWLPRSAKQIGLRSIIVPCLRKREITFAKIVF